MVSDPSKRSELARQTGQPPQALTAAVGCVRRVTMARRMLALVRKAG